MKNNKFKLGIVTFSFFTILFATSCVDLNVTPYDQISDTQYWNKSEAAVDALNTCYTNLMSAQEVIFGDATTDNAYCKGGVDQAIGNGSYSTSDGYVQSVWASKYAGIRNCNILLDNIDKVPGLTADLKNRYIAEAKVIRAYLYFELYSRFGDIPFFTKAISIAESQSLARTPKADVVKELLAELTDIITNNYLPESYPAADKGRVTRYAAMALEARMLLFDGRYPEVKTITDNIISKSQFSLFPSYEGLFYAANEGNQEVILDIQYMLTTRENNVEYSFLPPSMGGYSQLAPLQELVDSYVASDGLPIDKSAVYSASKPYLNRDPRLAATIVYTGNSYLMADGTLKVINCDKGANKDGYGFSSDCTPTGFYLKKYWDKDNSTIVKLSSGLNIILIRYADVLLMNAEAAAVAGTLDATTWNTTIKPLRVRAGFTNPLALNFPTGSSQQDLLDIVRRERRSELAFEGLRYNDIVRWKTAETVMNGWCHGLKTNDIVGTDNGFVQVEKRAFNKAKHYLWPIPQTERDLNKNLTQNPNW
ncbi:MAG: RagB/SusD family nutrient uptake outer membrane protein [Bacteroidota bacterium]|nr:RagB/SusD family nutrient uptake outer membrane protein [Bacteroidota bacterium]